MVNLVKSLKLHCGTDDISVWQGITGKRTDSGSLIDQWETAILVPPRIVPFEFAYGDDLVTTGQPMTVQCMIAEGDTPITFRWSFHGKELSSQMGISTSRINSRVSLLSIDSIEAGHAGDYTCTAQNSAGLANHTAVLLVQGFFRSSSTFGCHPITSHLGSLRSVATFHFFSAIKKVSKKRKSCVGRDPDGGHITQRLGTPR